MKLETGTPLIKSFALTDDVLSFQVPHYWARFALQRRVVLTRPSTEIAGGRVWSRCEVKARR